MKFLAKDGRTFDDIADCEKYEAELKAKEDEQKKYSKERDRRWREVSDAYEKYEELYDKYVKDYPGYRDRWSTLFDLLQKLERRA